MLEVLLKIQRRQLPMDEIDWKKRAETYEIQLRELGIQPIEKRGLRNWKNLFRRPTLSDWITLFLIAMALFMGWAYMHDIQTCHQTLSNLDQICLQINKMPSNISGSGSTYIQPINLSSLDISK